MTLRFALLSVAVAGCVPVAQAPAPESPAPPIVTLLGNGPRAALLALEVSAGGHYAVPHDGCQDAIVVVRAGAVRAELERHASIAVGEREAVRFGGGALVRGRVVAERDSALYVVLARDDAHAFPVPAIEHELEAPSGCRLATTALRHSTAATIGPYPSAEGRLRVSIFADEPNQGSDLASVDELDGDADLPVPEHVHDASDELLFFESGEGTMRLGDATIDIGPRRFVFVPHGTVHGLVPTGRAPLRALQVYTPSGPEQRFRPADAITNP